MHRRGAEYCPCRCYNDVIMTGPEVSNGLFQRIRSACEGLLLTVPGEAIVPFGKVILLAEQQNSELREADSGDLNSLLKTYGIQIFNQEGKIKSLLKAILKKSYPKLKLFNAYNVEPIEPGFEHHRLIVSPSYFTDGGALIIDTYFRRFFNGIATPEQQDKIPEVFIGPPGKAQEYFELIGQPKWGESYQHYKIVE